MIRRFVSRAVLKFMGDALKKLGWGRVDRGKQISLDRMGESYRQVSAGMSKSVFVF